MRTLCSKEGELQEPSQEHNTDAIFCTGDTLWCYVAYKTKEDAQQARFALHNRDTPLGRLIVDWHNNNNISKMHIELPQVNPWTQQIPLYVTFERAIDDDGTFLSLEREEIMEIFSRYGPIDSVILKSHDKDSRRVLCMYRCLYT